MSEKSSSLGQEYLAHERRKAQYVHTRQVQSSPSQPEEDPLKGYLAQKLRIDFSPALGSKEVVENPKIVDLITSQVDKTYDTNMSHFEQIRETEAKNQELIYDGKLKESKVLSAGPGKAAFMTAINDAVRYGYDIGIFMADLDNFKLANGKYGHLGADDILRVLARAARKTTKRRNDLIIRFGGEEIFIVMPGLKKEELGKKAEEWRSYFREFQLPFLDEEGNKIDEEKLKQLRESTGLTRFPKLSKLQTMSIGGTHFDHNDPRVQLFTNGALADELMAEADDATDASKGLGKDQVKLYEEIDDKYKKNTLLPKKV